MSLINQSHLIHADHISFLANSVKEGILPELHLVPQIEAILAQQPLEKINPWTVRRGR